MTKMRVDGLLFDKDGTLFDFGATWNVWSLKLIRDFSGGDTGLAQAIADTIGFDLVAQSFLPTSPVIAVTNSEVAELFASAIPGADVAEIEHILTTSAVNAPLAPAVPLVPFLDGLLDAGLKLGVMTNDSEMSAHGQLAKAGVLERFQFIAGFDSGHGAKPAAAPLLAFSTALSLDPARVAMVGDSTHDLIAGRAAGMQTVAVLTGMADAAELAPFADVVFPDIGHLTAWVQG